MAAPAHKCAGRISADGNRMSTLHVVIAGAGPAGAYLARRLGPRHEVEVRDPRSFETLGEDCAWGISLPAFRHFARRAGLAPGDYILCRRIGFQSDLYQANASAVVDKNAFLRALLRRSGASVRRERMEDRAEAAGADLLVDATGRKRALLPRCGGRDHWMLPCYQLVAEGEGLPPGFLLQQRGLGYLWAFPLDEDAGTARVGCGSFDVRPRRAVEQFLADLAEQGSCRVRPGSGSGGAIRLLPPSRSLPLFQPGRPPVIGVGEAVGTVNPLTGDGIGPALRSAEMVAQMLLGRENNVELSEVGRTYRSRLLRRFRWVDRSHRFFRALRFGTPSEQLWGLITLQQPPGALVRYSRVKATLNYLRRTAAP